MEPQTSAEKAVSGLLLRHMTVSFAESCTGGMISAALVDVSGASECFGYGFVTYANEAKMSELSVREETLTRYGAVSAECAREMAEGCRNHAGSDVAVAVTGIAGPGGGTKEKPVGLVYIGISTENGTKVMENHFSGDRTSVRTQTKEKALLLLVETLEKEFHL